MSVKDDEDHIWKEIQNYINSKTEFQILELNQNTVLSFKNLIIDAYHRRVISNGEDVKMTDLEFRLLFHLAQQPGRVFSYQQIYEAVWGEEYTYEKGNIMSHIRHIRAKIESDDSMPGYIENIRGVGYRFRE